MKKLATFILISLLFTFCNKKADKPKIEKFVWIEHNQNWVGTNP